MTESHILNTYYRLPIKISKGNGIYIYDNQNNEYLDFASGIAVTNIGHSNKYINKILQEQSEKIWHCANLFTIENQEKLAKRLCDLSFADKVFFCSSGLEAVETAVKLIRKNYFAKYGKEDSEIISLENSFHGRGLTSLSIGGGQYAKEGFGPFPKGFKKIPIYDIEALKNSLTSRTSAIILEPIQSEGGVYPLDPSYLQKIAQIAQAQGILICFDEVQTGYGRSGSLFAYQDIGVTPDIMTLAKGIGNGFPLAACLMTKQVADNIKPGMHGSTYGGNPLATAVGNAVLDIVSQANFFVNKQEIIQYLAASLQDLQQEFPDKIKEVRGKGFIWGMEFYDILGVDMLNKLIKKGLVVTKTAQKNTIRILPPLIIEKEHIDKMQQIFRTILTV